MKTISRSGLGKGLSVIFHDLQQQNNLEKSIVAVELNLKDITPNPHQPRKYFDDDAMQELKKSIEREGVLQPILVRKIVSTEKEDYQIIAGERRWRAATQVNLQTIPAIILECDDQTALQLGLIENLQRDGLSPLEEATSIRSLMEDFHKTQEEIAEMLSKSRSYVANTVRLLRLPETVQELLRTRKITAGHARAILDAEDPEAMAQKIIQNNLSVRETEDMMKPYKSRSKKENCSPTTEQNSDILALENTFSGYFQTKVKISTKGDGGVIQIYFKDYNVLDDILNKVSNP